MKSLPIYHIEKQNDERPLRYAAELDLFIAASYSQEHPHPHKQQEQLKKKKKKKKENDQQHFAM